MKEVSDNEFDRLFKEKSDNFDYQFEEEAWVLMEKKLRKRDRIIYIRNFSIAALVLFFLGTGLYLYTTNDSGTTQIIAKKEQVKDSSLVAGRTHTNKLQETGKSESATKEPVSTLAPALSDSKQVLTGKNNHSQVNSAGQQHAITPLAQTAANKNTSSLHVNVQPSALNASLSADDRQGSEEANASSLVTDHLRSTIADSLTHLATLQVTPSVDSLLTKEKPITVNEHSLADRIKHFVALSSKPKFSFTLAAGPDYSSIQSLKGKQGNLNVGLLLNLSYKKFTLSTGAKYGLKKYSAGAFDYALNNPANANSITEIIAACNVLEIPAQLSYTAFKYNKQRIDISAGLSSYLMLKENYQFCYKPETGRPDYFLQKNNANQSYFGVMSLSASYKFKPIKQNILVGIEPYAKLPLGGVGEGKVHLKSSGIAITMTYELFKKH